MRTRFNTQYYTIHTYKWVVPPTSNTPLQIAQNQVLTPHVLTPPIYSLNDCRPDGVVGFCKSSFNSVSMSLSIFKQHISTDLHFDLYANLINSVKPPHMRPVKLKKKNHRCLVLSLPSYTLS